MNIPKDSRNRHLGFELEMRNRLTVPLARLEAQIALNALVQRTFELESAVPANALHWRKSLIVRGLERKSVNL